MSSTVLLVESIGEQLIERSSLAAPYETGGILLGILGDERPWVTGALEVPSAAPRRYAYELPAGVTRALVREARESDPRIGYLGDWHSHPADARASLTDLRTYKQMLRLAVRRLEQPPLLVVVRFGPAGWTRDVIATGRWFLEPKAVEVVLTGPPPAP